MYAFNRTMDFFAGSFTRLSITIAVLVAAVVAFAVYDDVQWSAFSTAHDCRIVAHHSGTTGYGMTSTGKMGTIYVSGNTTYHCNDGVDYTR
jgi:hypothetical protein